MDFKNINNYLNFNNSSDSIDNINKPKLIEPGVKYFFKGILKECHNYKQKNYSLVYNISLFILFFSILGIILFYRYKGNKTSQEKYQKNLQDKQYIMSKLVYYNRSNLENQQRVQNNMITNLPDFSNHPEASLLHRKIYF
jgi:hypothetical protein|tara:strand:+ start:3337 stop:3756 length:420 start_codon:yes stop_codon:yes gene_type:complete